MPRIYFYKLTCDDNGAPCVHDELLSLAICKPMIRSTAQEGDIIVGFAANSLHRDNRLIYVARVTKKLRDGTYFREGEYMRRPDCIYQWDGERFVVRRGARYHGSQGDLQRDLGVHPSYPRANTIVSDKFCYFGATGSAEYKLDFPLVAEAIRQLGRGHRVHHNAQLFDSLGRLVAYVCPLEGPCVRGEPSSAPRRGVSHREGGCGVVEP